MLQAQCFRSSGHASVAFLCAVYLTLWLCGKTSIMKKTRGALWLQLLLLAPEVAAAALAFSQVRCYYHSVEDVMGGILLGSVLAVWSYLMSYPGPWEPYCGEPKPCDGWKPVRLSVFLLARYSLLTHHSSLSWNGRWRKFRNSPCA